MWFVGCVDPDGRPFNMPWYWTEAHPSERNSDRSNYQLFRVENQNDLDRFQRITTSKSKYALELMPIDLTLMRNMEFIEAVGKAAGEANIPVIIAGSTLAHAYFALRRQGCTVVARGEKDHTRVRRSMNFGKIVRDKIPARIAQRKEAEITRKLPENIQKNFLISKLLEEALEVRNAEARNEQTLELADLLEIVRALARLDGISIEEVVKAADEKRAKAGGFDEGLVLIQTGILGRSRDSIGDDDKALTQVLAQKTSGDTYELPFTFFGFMEIDLTRSLAFENLGVILHLTLKNDRIEIRLSKGPEQLELPLDMSVSQGG
jgi:predicted house-cleaning noncanonical NTP pyrophosphatase (MazG superfamily)